MVLYDKFQWVQLEFDIIIVEEIDDFLHIKKLHKKKTADRDHSERIFTAGMQKIYLGVQHKYLLSELSSQPSREGNSLIYAIHTDLFGISLFKTMNERLELSRDYQSHK